MKTTCREKAAVLAILVAISTTSVSNLRATEIVSNSIINLQNTQSMSTNGGTLMNGVMMKDGKMMVIKEGKTGAMDEDMTMTDGTRILKNGTILTKDGKTMMMTDSQRMNADGQMIGSDGQIATTNNQASGTENNVMSRVVIMKDDKLMVMKDGTSTQMTEDMSMSDGTTILKNGTILTKDGKTLMMKNGQMVLNNGQLIDHLITK